MLPWRKWYIRILISMELVTFLNFSDFSVLIFDHTIWKSPNISAKPQFLRTAAGTAKQREEKELKKKQTKKKNLSLDFTIKIFRQFLKHENFLAHFNSTSQKLWLKRRWLKIGAGRNEERNVRTGCTLVPHMKY